MNEGNHGVSCHMNGDRCSSYLLGVKDCGFGTFFRKLILKLSTDFCRYLSVISVIKHVEVTFMIIRHLLSFRGPGGGGEDYEIK